MYAQRRESQNVTVASKDLQHAVDELYALPPGDFTRARDERAKALRKAGRREEADAVKGLRKPTVAAWALNQLARQRAREVERLLAAGEALRAAQEDLLAGGDREAFQRAAAKERDEVARLAGEAAELTTQADEKAGAALREKVAETLHAAALDEETAEELRAGRLVREREAIGGFAGVMAPPAPAGARRATGQSAKNGSTEADAARGRKASAGSATRSKGSGARRDKASGGRGKSRKAAIGTARTDAKQRAEAERRDAAERRQLLAAARTDERHARRELDAADKAIAHAETRAEAARIHAEEANARSKTTAERLKEARRVRAAAKKAHARAERALTDAERGT